MKFLSGSLKKSNPNLLEKDQYNRTFLHIAAASGNLELISFLIDQGLDVNEIDGTGWTPLHFAAEKNQLEATKLLIENTRVNINCKDFVFESSRLLWHKNGNCTPLHHAVHNNNPQMVKLFLSNPKIQVNILDGENVSFSFIEHQFILLH